MKSICYIVPYFGKLPVNFQVWLNTCSYNKSINWIIITNDITEFNYPINVKCIYMTFEELNILFQEHFDFPIKIQSFWCIALFKPAYGEIFHELICNYDFWGYCDIDLLWGNIRKYITDDILSEFEKIGFQGHSTLYKNTKEVNGRYKTIVPGVVNYVDVFSGKKTFSFDENGIGQIYEYLKIPYYKKTNFAHLSKYDYSFFLKYQNKNEAYKNKRQVFIWNKGNLIRLYLNCGKIYQEEFMYIHFFCRPIIYKTDGKNIGSMYLIYPDVVREVDVIPSYHFITKYGKCSRFMYYYKNFFYNKNKLTFKRIIGNIERMVVYKNSKSK